MTVGNPTPTTAAAQFAAVDLRVGRVVSVETFPEARKPSLKVTVDFGPIGILRTSAQIKNYAADELLGGLVVGAVNVGEKNIAGFRSQFLLLGAMGTDGTVRLLRPDGGATPGEPIG
jgi:tRNA-binding protein